MDISDHQAVKNAVEQFLKAAGNNDLDAIESMAVANANVGSVSLNEGVWTTATMSIQNWIAAGRADKTPTMYTEPVTDWTIHIDGGRLAFVRADALLLVGAAAKRHNIDYFILVKMDGEWKFLSLSYLGQPIEPS